MMRKAGQGGLVYSTEGGRMCPACRRPLGSCTCAKRTPGAGAPTGPVRVARETKGRGGKTVTTVRGLTLDAAALEGLAKRLKTACGSGGTVKDGSVEIQGDHTERILEVLEKEGHAVRRSAG